jgi:ribosome-associated protein
LETTAARSLTSSRLAAHECRSLQLALAAARTAADNQGSDIVILDLRQITPVFDFFVIATGRSRRQLHAMAEDIDHVLEDELGDRRLGREGFEDSQWILLDYGNVVIHLFDPDKRRYYDLEGLWGGAGRVPFAATSRGDEASAPIGLPR